jgi:hypothetical protein
MSTPKSTTFAELVGQVAMDAQTAASVEQVVSDELFGLFLMAKMSRAGLRVVRVTDDNIGPDEPTVELPVIDLPLAVRVRQAMDADLLELERTAELPALLMRQAE